MTIFRTLVDLVDGNYCHTGLMDTVSHNGKLWLVPKWKPAKPALLQNRRYFTRRPLKNPALVVFCLMLAVSPCSAVFTSPFTFATSLFTSEWSPVPLLLRFAGGTGGIALRRDMFIPRFAAKLNGVGEFWFQRQPRPDEAD
jgi:hypothetical protein